MFTPHDLLWGIIAPVVIAAVAMVLAHLPRRSTRPRDAQPWGAALALAGGFAVALIGIRGRPAFPPVAADGWLALAAGPVILIAIVATLLPKQRWLDVVASIVLLALLAWVLMQRRHHALEPKEWWTWTIAAAAGMVIWWAAMDILASRMRGPALPLLLAITSLASAAVLVNARSQAYGQLAAALGFALVGTMVLGFWLKGATLSRGGIPAVAAIALGLLICGFHYADLALRDLILLAAAPLTAWLGEFLPGKWPGKWAKTRFAVRLIALLVVLAIPLVPALKGLMETMKEQQESYQY